MKRELLVTTLLSGWIPVSELQQMLGWQAHTLRAAISGVAKIHKVERQRIDGVTSYRILREVA